MNGDVLEGIAYVLSTGIGWAALWIEPDYDRTCAAPRGGGRGGPSSCWPRSETAWGRRPGPLGGGLWAGAGRPVESGVTPRRAAQWPASLSWVSEEWTIPSRR